jgi:hypothetical protein
MRNILRYSLMGVTSAIALAACSAVDSQAVIYLISTASDGGFSYAARLKLTRFNH